MLNRHDSREFQRLCVLRLEEVLRKHGYAEVSFEKFTDHNDFYSAELEIWSQSCEIAVYEDNIVMRCGHQIFECYLPVELEDDSSLRESFAKRLDRYLGGDPWAGPDEPGPWEWIVRLARLLAFWRR